MSDSEKATSDKLNVDEEDDGAGGLDSNMPSGGANTF